MHRRAAAEDALLLCGCALCEAGPPSDYAEGEAALAFDFERPRRIARRALLAGAAAALTALPASAQTIREQFRPQVIQIAIINTLGERLSLPLWTHGRYHHDALNQLYRLMRDQRENRQTFVDVELFEILARIHMALGRPIRLVSGYRTERTNEMLRAADPNGVARHSFHIQGRAADFRVDGVAPARIAQVARRFRAGGVGVYASGFVHVDTGPPRSWTYGRAT